MDKFLKDDRDVEIADLEAKLALMTDARYRMEQRVELLLRFLSDTERDIATLKSRIHEALIAGGKW